MANDKFQRRFDDVERQVTASGKKFRETDLDQLEITGKGKGNHEGLITKGTK